MELIKVYLAGAIPAAAIDSSISKSIGFCSTSIFLFIQLELYFIVLSSVLVCDPMGYRYNGEFTTVMIC